MNITTQPVTLIIIHWNRPAQCEMTVTSFLDQGLTIRPVVIDNHSDEDNYTALQQAIAGRATVVRLDQNQGWGRAANVGLREWLGSEMEPFCLISAHDAQLSPNCLQLLLHAAERDPAIGIACPQYADGTVACLSRLHGVRLSPAQPKLRGEVELMDVPHGTLMLLRRSCLSDIGLFDERYFAYGDEHELGARARRRNWKVAMVWGATVANPETSTPAPWRSYLFARNSLLLVHDYFGKLSAGLRASIILFTSLGSALKRQPAAESFAPHARWRAVCDFLVGRYGPPPALG